MRRTFAKLAPKGQGRLEEIQLSLRHAYIRTAERDLGIEQDSDRCAVGGQAGTSSRIENYLGLPRRLATRALPSRRRDVEELLA
jgi:hypothetical protein